MTVLSKPFKKRKECNRTDLTAYANSEYDRLCFILVPVRGKINLGPRPQDKILVPFRSHFQKIRRAPPSLLYGSVPPSEILFTSRSVSENERASLRAFQRVNKNRAKQLPCCNVLIS